jgi:hypothetical protein
MLALPLCWHCLALLLFMLFSSTGAGCLWRVGQLAVPQLPAQQGRAQETSVPLQRLWLPQQQQQPVRPVRQGPRLRLLPPRRAPNWWLPALLLPLLLAAVAMRWLQASLLVLGLHQLGRAGNSLQDRDRDLVLVPVSVLVLRLLLLGAAACWGASWDSARPKRLQLPVPASAVWSPLRVYLSLARGPTVSHRTLLYHPQHPQQQRQQQLQRQQSTRLGAGSLRLLLLLLLLLLLHQMQQALPEARGA